MAVIYITEADSTQHKFRLPVDPSVVITIGREEGCVIPMPGIIGLSGLHCSIALVGSEYVITDEGSSNGTLDGERAISSEPLRAGVVYSIGNAALTFDPEIPAAVPAEPVVEPAPAAEPLPTPVEVSEYAAPAAEAPVEAALAETVAPAAPVKKKKKKSAKALKAMPVFQTQSQTMTAVNYLYVIIVLAIAFYAGMTLRHWMVTGSFLPEAPPAEAAVEK